MLKIEVISIEPQSAFIADDSKSKFDRKMEMDDTSTRISLKMIIEYCCVSHSITVDRIS